MADLTVEQIERVRNDPEEADLEHVVALCDAAIQVEAMREQIVKLTEGNCLKCGIGPRRETCAYPEACLHPGYICAMERNQMMIGNVAMREAIGRAVKDLRKSDNMDEDAKPLSLLIADLSQSLNPKNEEGKT